MTIVLALDAATVTGFCHGPVGGTPAFGSIRFGGRSADGLSDRVFFMALCMVEELIERVKPDVIFIESLLPPDSMKGRTSRATRDRLAGLHGVIKAVAHKHGVGEVAEAGTANIRHHFIDERGLQRQAAKSAVIRKCKALGWDVGDDEDAADAVALWSFACSMLDPQQALRVTPLFNQSLTRA